MTFESDRSRVRAARKSVAILVNRISARKRECYSASHGSRCRRCGPVSRLPPRVAGRLRVPGDKSISHRYAMLAALADGVSTIHGYSPAPTALATLACLRGARRPHSSHAGPASVDRSTAAASRGLPRARPAARRRQLRHDDAAAVGHPRGARVPDRDGRRRLAQRAGRCAASSTPLTAMGARIASDDGRPPLTIDGARLHGITYQRRSAERAGEERRAAGRPPGRGRPPSSSSRSRHATIRSARFTRSAST